MKPITLRNIPPEIAGVIRRRARETGTSLNKAVIGMLAEVLGNRTRNDADVDRNDLDALAGRWSKPEGQKFDATLAGQRQVDTEMWK